MSKKKHNKEKAEKQDQHITDLEDTTKRLQAEFDNFRKQIEKEKAQTCIRANASLVQKLLPVLDEFEHSLQEAEKHSSKDILQGFTMVHENLWKLLQAEGLKEMDGAVGESFDPYKHQAVRHEEGDLEEGKIISVVRRGYYFHNHVLRPANVVVSKGGGKK